MSFVAGIKNRSLPVYPVSPAVGSGVNPTYLSQAAWFIDPENGNDGNTGLTALTAIKTNAEFSKRLGLGNTLTPPGTGGPVPVVIPITYLNPAPVTDPLNLNVVLGSNVQLNFIGTLAIVSTPLPGGVTFVQTKNRSSNTPWTLTLASGNASPSVTTRITDTTQATSSGQPNWFFGVKDEGTGVLRISEPFNIDFSRYTPLASDTFDTQTLPTLTVGSLIITGQSGPATTFQGPQGLRPTITFTDLDFNLSTPSVLNTVEVFVVFEGCIFTQNLDVGPSVLTFFVNCLLYPAATIPFPLGFFQVTGGFTEWFGGAMIAVLPIMLSSTVRFDGDAFFQSCSLAALSGSRWLIGTAASFDGLSGGPGNQNPQGDGLHIGEFADVSFVTDIDDTNFFWGNNAAGAGIGFSGGARLAWQGALAGNLLGTVVSIVGTTVTFSQVQTLQLGQALTFSSQPGVEYNITFPPVGPPPPVTPSLTATLSTPYTGPSAAGATTTLIGPITVTGAEGDAAWYGKSSDGAITTNICTQNAAGVYTQIPPAFTWDNFFSAAEFGGTAVYPPTQASIVPSGISE